MKTSLLALCLALPACAAPVLMPLPAKMTPGTGRLGITQSFRVALSGPSDEPRVHASAVRLIARLAAQTGMPLNPVFEPDAAKATLVIAWSSDGLPVQALGEDESYHLSVDSNQARIQAPNALGALRGMETFLQLVEVDAQGFAIPGITIDDAPRFPWRGLMLDCSRHFMPLDVVLRNLDGMAALKLNVFHWHLSDDQGFRVESKHFPRLQQMGSDGLYYTQNQIRQVIAYARERGIRVIPEFDMPGHSLSWLVGYPELATSAGPFEIGRHWGGFEALMNPASEDTYRFLDSFLSEMAGLFPDEYFHIGGDEVNDKEWRNNPTIQSFIQTHALDGSRGLQAYFNKRIQLILAKYGKHMEGWDEILNPDLPRNIVIQSWRGQKSLAQASRLGFQGILSSGYYLDLMQTAARHYQVDPLTGETAGLSDAEKARILGGEAAMWTEYVSPETVDSRIWPRLGAIAERLWSPANVTDVADMYRRLAVMSDRLEAFGLQHNGNYAAMLRRIAGPGPVGPLRVLADATEPGKGYLRDSHHYLQQTPLNRLVDAERPESDEARHFADLVDRIVAKPDPADIAEARRILEAWKANDEAVQPVFAASFLASENAQLSHELSTVSATGIEALHSIETRRARPKSWIESNRDELEKMRKGRAEIIVPIIPAVEKLVTASGERPGIKEKERPSKKKRKKS
jgi:hexosaminidase